MKLQQKDKFTLTAGIVSLFAFITMFFPPLFVKNGGSLYFYQVFFGVGLEYYKGATLSAIAYFVLLIVAIGFALCTFTKLKNYKIIKIVLSVFALVSAFAIFMFTSELYANSLWAPEWIEEAYLLEERAKLFASLEKGVSLYFCLTFGVFSAVFGVLSALKTKREQ